MNNYFARAIARASGTSRITPIAAARIAPAPVLDDSLDEPGDGARVEGVVPATVPPVGAPDRAIHGGLLLNNRVDAGRDTAGPRPSSDRGVTAGEERRAAAGDPPASSAIASDSGIRRPEPHAQPQVATTATVFRDPRSLAVDANALARAAGPQPRADAIESFLLMPASVQTRLVPAQALDAHDPVDSRRRAANAARVFAPERRSDRRESARDEVHITIGRLEVTAVHAPAPPRRPSNAPTDPAMSLDQYLARRRGGR